MLKANRSIKITEKIYNYLVKLANQEKRTFSGQLEVVLETYKEVQKWESHKKQKHV